jgi:hypothetical protein
VADYSVTPLDLLLANQQKGYVGIHVEQGVPVLDRDLNLLHDLVAATVRDVVTRYIGNGSPAGADGFAVQALSGADATQNFTVAPGITGLGRCLVGGIEVTIAAPVRYHDQPGAADLTTPTTAQPDPRIDTVYLDVFLIEVDGTVDTDLTNAADVGVQTSVRLKPAWVIRVAEGMSSPPPPPPGHNYATLAQISRKRGVATIDPSMITDLRQRGLTVSDVERRLRKVENALLPSFTAPEFLPRTNVPGGSVTITGANFNIGTCIVRFNTTPAASITVDSPTQITAIVPRGIATEGNPVSTVISVENAAGPVNADGLFGVLPAPAFAPPGSQFTPVNGVAGVSVTLKGDNFNRSGFTVQFGSTTAVIVGTPTAHQAVVQVPPGLVPSGNSSANVKITITTDLGTVVSDDTFRAEQVVPAPTFTTPNFTPKLGAGGDNITLNGTNFNAAGLVVKFDTVTATVVGTPTATQIVAKVPAGMTSGGVTKSVKLSVTTAGGTVTSTDNFGVTG